MHKMTLGQVFVLHEAMGEYVVLTNPFGSPCPECDHGAHDGKKCDECSCFVSARSSSRSGPSREMKTTGDYITAASTDPGAVVNDTWKSVDQLPPHLREMFGRN